MKLFFRVKEYLPTTKQIVVEIFKDETFSELEVILAYDLENLTSTSYQSYIDSLSKSLLTHFHQEGNYVITNLYEFKMSDLIIEEELNKFITVEYSDSSEFNKSFFNTEDVFVPLNEITL